MDNTWLFPKECYFRYLCEKEKITYVFDSVLNQYWILDCGVRDSYPKGYINSLSRSEIKLLVEEFKLLSLFAPPPITP